MQILIADKADVNARCYMPPRLSLSLPKAQLLIAEGADVNATDKEGHIPLHASLVTSHFEVAKLLLNHKAL